LIGGDSWIASSRPSWATWSDLVSKKKKNEGRKERDKKKEKEKEKKKEDGRKQGKKGFLLPLLSYKP
jgi:hypothetical protein